MYVQLDKPKLFPREENVCFGDAFFLFVICIWLFIEYQSYQRFISKPFYYTYAKVLNTYEKSKGNKRYQVLKLRSEDGLTFYTTNYSKENFNHKRLRLQIYPDKRISFTEYLGTFYVKSHMKAQELLPLTFKDTLLEKVDGQHTNTSLQSFYNAIFFATPLGKDLREKISMLGVSHLVALSGFHLGILWGLVYGVLLLFYTPLQQLYFPYRHALI